jgi:hypothetical protein
MFQTANSYFGVKDKSSIFPCCSVSVKPVAHFFRVDDRANRFFWNVSSYKNRLGYMVAHLVEAMSYKPKGHGFNSQWSQQDFSLLKPSSRIMVLGSTQPLIEISTKDISWGLKMAGV